MKPVLILTLLIAVQPLKSCGSLKGVGTQTPAPDASITTPCARPEAFLSAGDWAIIAGRIGDALIDCGENHKALVDRDKAMRAR